MQTMTAQQSLDFGRTLKEKGIKRSLESAERKNPGWQQAAYSFLCEFVKKSKGEFLCEDVREASKGIVPEPVSKRAWGGIFYKASYWKIIQRVGYRKVENPDAHQCFASVWRAV